MEIYGENPLFVETNSVRLRVSHWVYIVISTCFYKHSFRLTVGQLYCNAYCRIGNVYLLVSKLGEFSYAF